MKHQHPRRRPLRSLAPLSGLAALLIAGATVSTSLGQTARPAATQPATAPASADPDADAELYRGTDRFLGAVVTEAGFVDYAEARRHRKQLDQLVASLAKDRGKRTREQTLALLINAYNLLVIQQVLDEWPVESVIKEENFFDARRHTVLGRTMSLDELENQYIRRFRDARIHAALVCAAVSCPPLRDEAYVPGRLDEQLEANTRRWLSSDNNRVEDGVLVLSQIFQWFEEDFRKARGDGPASFVARHAPEDSKLARVAARDDVEIRYADYDWALNDASD